MFPDFVTEVLNDLKDEKYTQAIWFIGSRANNDVSADSDWDFLVFRSGNIQVREARHPKVDVIQVSGRQYLLEGKNLNMSGDFSKWMWREIGPGLAQYTVRKSPDVECGVFDVADVKYINCNGFLVWQEKSMYCGGDR